MARRNPQNEEIILFTKQISNYAYNRAYTKPTALSLRKYPVILVFSVFLCSKPEPRPTSPEKQYFTI